MNGPIHTKTHYSVFAEILSGPGPRLTEVAKACGISDAKARSIINDLIHVTLIIELGRRFYVTEDGIKYAALHNRAEVETIKLVITQPPKSNQMGSSVLTKRDDAINGFHSRLRQEGFDVGDGRRMGIGRPTDKQRWFPDLWVRIPARERAFVWHAVVVDPSSRAENTIREILQHYRYAVRKSRDDKPLLVVCRDDAAALVFGELGDDLPMMVATYGDCRKGAFYGSDSVWRFLGTVEDIDFLSKQMAPN